jgi:purine-nucleoside phosphorylase
MSDAATSAPNPTALAEQAAEAIAAASGVARHDVAVVLGSGWGEAADRLGELIAEVPMADVPGFTAPAVTGHTGRLRSVRAGDRHVLVSLGRTHLYEGRGVAAVAHGVRTAAAAGCRVVVLTNGAGGLNPDWGAGTVVRISDHLNLTATSSLVGAQFVDLSEVYSARLRALAAEVDPSLPEGVYAGLPGPHYETPAEIRMLRTLGADLVGMSTVLEAIAARAAGLEVLGLSLVTNLAAGMTDAALDHAEVLEAGAAAAPRMGALLAQVAARA